MPPAYRNPNNDPPRLGEIVHYTGARYEHSGIISEVAPLMTTCNVIATIFHPHGPEIHHLTDENYDPTDNPATHTWHFDHR